MKNHHAKKKNPNPTERSGAQCAPCQACHQNLLAEITPRDCSCVQSSFAPHWCSWWGVPPGSPLHRVYFAVAKETSSAPCCWGPPCHAQGHPPALAHSPSLPTSASLVGQLPASALLWWPYFETFLSFKSIFYLVLSVSTHHLLPTCSAPTCSLAASPPSAPFPPESHCSQTNHANAAVLWCMSTNVMAWPGLQPDHACRAKLLLPL